MPSLFYLIGASGSGKDSLIRAVRARSGRQDPVRLLFAHRYITRPRDPSGSEDHLPVSPAEFAAMRAADLFALHWESHGLGYGVGREILSWLNAGFDVAVNGSREYLPEATRRVPNLRPVLVKADPEALKVRLTARGRETEDSIQERLQRAAALDAATLRDWPDIAVVDNSGLLESAVRTLERLLLP